jgi:hypothetical protein
MLMGSFRRICAAARTILQAMDGRRSRGRPDPKKGPPVPSPRATRRGRPASPPRSSPPRTS